MHQISVTTIFLIVISTIVLFAAGDKFFINNKNFESDIPNERDLMIYLKSMDLNVRSLYAYNRGDSFKLNIIFGLFLMNVNLKHAIEKSRRLDIKVKNFTEEIIRYSEKIITFYHVLSSVLMNVDNPVYKRVATLFSDDRMWLKRIKKFHVAPPLRNFSSNFGNRWYSSDQYINKTLSYLDNSGQNPYQSDSCIASIAENKNGDFKRNPKCLIDRKCYDNIVNGTEYGYFLAHRIVQLMVANIGLGCSIVSKKNDAILMETMCTQAYYESEYIARHGYKNADLLLEFIALCSLSGQSQFIRYSWLKTLLELQTSYGWFEIPCAIRNLIGLNKANEEVQHDKGSYSADRKEVSLGYKVKMGAAYETLREESKIMKKLQQNKEEIRDIMHESAVAAAAFGAATRFIIEMYY